MNLTTEYKGVTVTQRTDTKGKPWRAMIDFYIDDPAGGARTNRDGSVTAKRVRRRKSYPLESTGKRAAEREAAAILKQLQDELETAKADAEQAELAAAEPEDPEEVERRRQRALLVTEYVTEFKDHRVIEKNLQPSTKADYEQSINYIAEGLGDVRMTELTRKMVSAWQGKLNKRGLSWSSTHKALRLLKAAMKQAVIDDVIVKNPCDGVDGAKKGSNSKKSGINALDFDGFARTLQALSVMSPSPATVAPQIALLAGLRRGEVCGLQWRDVDLGDPDGGKPATITVRQAIGTADGGEYVKAPKNGKTRTIVLPQALAELLRDWHGIECAAAAADGDELQPYNYVIGKRGTGTNGAGNPWAGLTQTGKEWATVARLLGIKGVADRLPTFHDLRHTYATIAIASGVDVKTVSHNLGHANAAITLNVYSAVLPDAQDKAAAAIQQAATRGIEAAKVLASEAIEDGGDE